MTRIDDKIIKFRWLIIFGFIAITIFFAMQIPKAEIDADLKSQLPENMPSRLDTDKIDELFGGTEMIMMLIKTDDILNSETLKRVKKISKKMSRIKNVDKVLSLFDLKNIKGEDGAMTVNPAIKRIPKNTEQREELRKEIQGNDIVYGSVVSKDFTITAIIAVLKDNVSDEYIIREIENLIDENPGNEETIIGGIPYIRGNVSRNIQTDMRRLMPIGLLIMMIFLFVCFKQLRGVLLPFSVVIMSIIFSYGIIPLLGWKIQVMTVILPVFLLAVANDYGIHMIAKYQEDNVPGNKFTKKELAKKIFNSLGKPVLITGLTTMAGMLCLLGHAIVPAKQLGILAAFGILFALSASLLFIPAVISLLPKPKPVLSPENTKRKSFLEHLLLFFGNLVSKHPKMVISVMLIFSILSSIGIFSIVVDTDPKNYFPTNHPVVYATDLIDQNLGGSQNLSLVYQGDIKDSRLMHKIDSMEQTFLELPEVGNTTSVARVIRQMSRALNDPDETGYDRIPDKENAVAQYFELYAMSGDAEDFEKMVDFPYEHAVITARMNTTSTAKLSQVVNKINNMTKDDPDILLIGGFGLVLSDLAKLMVNGQFLSLSLAAIIVALLLMILFKSVAAGLISAIPLVLSVAILFGLMGFFGIELNVVTALLSSIMIGVGIDYTIHFLWRYRKERQNGLSAKDAVRKTLTTTGRGIIFNAFSVIIGFIALLFSSFLPVKFFGFLVVVSIFSCLIGALVIIPALCLVLKPKFLEPK
ncbi:MAG: MMPL family transporter [Candidatus Cloacimonetes bacterium]|nr:MMPL family transporter [Candidatus Cloacimonadota bacterium]